MEKNLENVAVELFGKLRTQFPSIKLRDKDEDPTDIPKQARFFEFNYVKNNIDLGTITVSIDDNPDGESDGLVVMYSQDIVANQPDIIKRQWFRFLESLSDFASRHIMDYNVRDITKSNLDPRQQLYLANNRGDGVMSESKLWGTSRTSFQEMGEAKLIVKHSKPVNYDIPAGRAMHIESIFVESSEGERFKYPFKHLNGARALAVHVAHGGTSYDPIGKHIIGLSEELSKLRMFKGYVDRNEMVSEAMGNINSKVLERIDQVKKEIHSLQNKNYYQSFAESFTTSDNIEIPEDIVNDWIDRLTIRSFNEELKNVFPYIYKLVGEGSIPIKEIGADDLLTSLGELDPVAQVESEIKELTDFESYMNDLAMTEAEKDDDPPFDPDPPKKNKEAGDKAEHGGHSRAKHLAKAAMEKAKKAGAKKETVINIGGQEMTLGEAAKMVGLDPDEFFVESKGQTEIIEFIKSMFDENTGQFPKGEEGVKIAVEKEFGEGAGQIAERVIAELGQVFESNRIRKLAGLI